MRNAVNGVKRKFSSGRIATVPRANLCLGGRVERSAVSGFTPEAAHEASRMDADEAA